MHASRMLAITVLSILSVFALPAQALLGLGAHAGMDFSVDMDDAGEHFFFTKPIIQPSQTDTVVLDSTPDFTLSRRGWERTRMNFGGKFFVDVIPVVDAAEISFNFGVWEYSAILSRPAASGASLTSDTIPISFTSQGIDTRWGVDGIPFAKLHLDVTIRKYIVRLPKELKLLNLYAGGGFNLIMSTPIVTAQALEDEYADILLRDSYSIYNPDQMAFFSSSGPVKNVLNDIAKGLTERQGGIHFVVGLLFQIPVVPLALYGDAKVMLPFAEIGEAASLGGYGFVLNAGVALSVSGKGESHTKGFE